MAAAVGAAGKPFPGAKTVQRQPGLKQERCPLQGELALPQAGSSEDAARTVEVHHPHRHAILLYPLLPGSDDQIARVAVPR